MERVIFSRLTLVVAAIAVDLLLLFFGLHWVGQPMGDLNYAYQGWANTGSAFGVSVDWVYPFLAWLPIWLANLITPGNLFWGWLALWLVFQVTVLLILVTFRAGHSSRERFAAGYLSLIHI